MLELKDKLDDLAAATSAPSTPDAPRLDAVGEDALSALINLGYQRHAGRTVINLAPARCPFR